MRVDGELIRELRFRDDYGVEEFAQKVGVTRNTINSWEENETNPDSCKLFKIAYIFDYQMEDFIVHSSDELPKLFE